MQFVDAMERLLSSIRPELFTFQPITRVALLFGPSPRRPCEVYDVYISADQRAEALTGGVSPAHALLSHLTALTSVCMRQAVGHCDSLLTISVRMSAEPGAFLHVLTRSLVAAAADMPEGPASKGTRRDTSCAGNEGFRK